MAAVVLRFKLQKGFSYNIIHEDLHSGNILHSFKKISDASISDFGLCRPAGEIKSENSKENIWNMFYPLKEGKWTL